MRDIFANSLSGTSPVWGLRPKLSWPLAAIMLVVSSSLSAAQSVQLKAAIPSGQVITLIDAIKMGVSSSQKRAEAEYELQSQTAKRRAAISDIGPRISAEAGDLRYNSDVTAAMGPTTFILRPDHMVTGTLAVHQPITGIYTAFEHSRAERSQEQISELAVDLSRTEAAFGAAEVYLRAQQTLEMINIAQASIFATEAQVHDAQALLSSGRLIKSDLLRIKIAADDARAQLARAIADRDKTFDLLRYVLGLPDGADVSIEKLPSAFSVIQRYDTQSVAISHEAYQGRLELKQAALVVDKATHLKRVVHMKFVPQIEAFMKWDRIYSTPLPFGTPNYTETYGVAANWDLWDNGSHILAEQDVSAQIKKAQVAMQETKDHLRLELAGLTADLKAAREALSARMSVVAGAEEAYRLDKARFGIGLVTATDLVLSEASQTRARGAQLNSLIDVDILLLKIAKASGKTTP